MRRDLGRPDDLLSDALDHTFLPEQVGSKVGPWRGAVKSVLVGLGRGGAFALVGIGGGHTDGDFLFRLVTQRNHDDLRHSRSAGLSRRRDDLADDRAIPGVIVNGGIGKVGQGFAVGAGRGFGVGDRDGRMWRLHADLGGGSAFGPGA